MSRRNKNRKRRYNSAKPVDDTSKIVRKVYDSYADAGKVTGSKATTTTTRWCEHVGVPVRITTGMTIYASAWSDVSYGKAADRITPDIGLYLDSAWGRGAVLASPAMGELPFGQSGGAKILYPWSDGSSPDSLRTFSTMIEWLGDVILSGKYVETGCIGAHGRTGTLIAALIIRNRDLKAQDAIDWVRKHYCHKAIETHTQERFLKQYWNMLNGFEINHELPQAPAYTSKWDSYNTTQSGWSYNDKWGSTAGKGYGKRNDTPTYDYFDSTAGKWVTKPYDSFKAAKPPTVDKSDVAFDIVKAPRSKDYNDNADMNGVRDSIDESADLDQWLFEAEERAARRAADEAADREIWETLNEEYEIECMEDDCPESAWCSDKCVDAYQAYVRGIREDNDASPLR